MEKLEIRKLTPRECFRLMGVRDCDFEKVEKNQNRNSLYHLAGDSIVVNVLQALFKQILIDEPVLNWQHIRLIELFSGYGSQALALKYLGVPFEHWKTCEWAVKSIQAYKDIHFDKNKEYPKMSKNEMVSYLIRKGISSNYNEPMNEKQIEKLKENDLEKIIENIYTTNNLVNIQQVHGADLDIRERERHMC